MGGGEGTQEREGGLCGTEGDVAEPPLQARADDFSPLMRGKRARSA